ncbi:MAG TPA: PKD domain-containing protein [Thermoleophilaceae bacterium]|nr:PKD domain-containing protein [Thermoleophilaceae bacterium]
MHSPFKRLGAAAVTVTSILVLASSAHAAGWQALGTISPAGADASSPQVVAAPDGSMWLEWETDRAQIQRIAPDGTAGPVIDLTTDMPYQTVLAMDSSGVMTAAWYSPSDGLEVRTVQPNGTLGTEHAVGDSDAGLPLSIGMDGSGVATLSYTEPYSGTNHNQILWAQRLHGGDLAGSPVQISTNPNESVEEASISTNSAGDSVLTWGFNNYTDLTYPYSWGERVRQLKADGSLGTEHDLIGTPQYGDVTASTAAIMPSGDAYLGFVQTKSTGNDMKVAKLSAGDTLSAVGTFETDTAVGDNSYPPQIALNSAGQAIVLWTAHTPSNDYYVVSRRIQADGTIDPPLGSDPDVVSGSDVDTSYPTLLSLPDGKALATWLGYDYPDYPVHTAVIDPSSGPGPVVPVGDDSGQTETLSGAADSNGDVFLAFDRTPDYNTWTVHGAFYDVQPPSVGTLAVPNAGAPGDTLVFGESASDRSGVQGYSWDFGDGHTASGAIVTHSYSAPGTYTVTATATDKTGNAATRTQQVVVRAPSSGNVVPSQPGSLKARLAGLHATIHLRRSRTLVLHLAAQPVDAFGSLRVRANAGHAARLVTLGSRVFPVFHGKALKLRVKLSPKTVKLARHHHGRLRVSVRLVLTGFNGNSAAHTYRLTIRTGR